MWTTEDAQPRRRSGISTPFLPLSDGPTEAIAKSAQSLNVDLAKCCEVRASKSGQPCKKPDGAR